MIVNYLAMAVNVAVNPSNRAPPKESGNVFSQCAILPERQGLQRPHVRNVSATKIARRDFDNIYSSLSDDSCAFDNSQTRLDAVRGSPCGKGNRICVARAGGLGA